MDFINTDLIAQGLSPFAPEKVAIQSGRLVLKRIHELFKKRKTFAFETTLSGRSYSILLRQMKSAGYRIHMYYLWIPNYQLAIERIKNRVLEGGHNVPVSDVKRRFSRTLYNLFHIYINLIDYLVIFDNSSIKPRAIFEKTKEGYQYINRKLFEMIKQEAG